MEKLLQRRSSCALYLSQRRPLFDEGAEQGCVDVLEPVERLRIVLFQRIASSIRRAYFVVHQATTLLDQRHQRTHRNALRIEGFEVTGMV